MIVYEEGRKSGGGQHVLLLTTSTRALFMNILGFTLLSEEFLTSCIPNEIND